MFSWIAAIFELSGAWLVGNKNRIGFIMNIIAAGFWVYVAIMVSEARGLLLVVIPAIFINIRNYIKWGKKTSLN